MNNVTINTPRLCLRQWRADDASNLFKIAKDKQVAQMAMFKAHRDTRSSNKMIREVLSKPNNLAICLKDDTVIGNISLQIGENNLMTLPNNQAVLSFWIGKEFWGNEYIPEALVFVMKYAFDYLHLIKLWCFYQPQNEQARIAQEKCGFEYNHTLEKVYLTTPPTKILLNVTSITKEQWNIKTNKK